jgi:hypothetical protein
MASSSTGLQILQIASQYWIYAGSKLFRNNRCIFYLIIETVSNILYQFVSITLTILTSIYGNNLAATSLIWCRLIYLLAQSFGLITFSMICFEAVDQLISTNYRCNLRQTCTLRSVQYFASITICIWLLHSFLCSFFVKIVPSIGCIVSNEFGIRYMTYFFYPVLAGFLPIVIASSFGLFAFRNVRRMFHITLHYSTNLRCKFSYT